MPPDRPSRPRTPEEWRSRLHAALEILRRHADGLERSPRSVTLAKRMQTWKGFGAVVTAMTALGYDLELMQQPHGWWARFYLSSASHPVCAGSGWAATPWAAVQDAAWETLTKQESRDELGHPQRGR